MNKSAARLKAMGCGDEMVRCQIERGHIQAMIHNTRDELKYLNYAERTGLYVAELVDVKKKRLITELRKIKPLVNKFNALYGEEYANLLQALKK